MNKKGFTLVELLAVIVILALISLIAVPNITGIIENNKKDLMISDAKKLIAQAENKINENPNLRASDQKLYMKDLNKLGTVDAKNAFNEEYDQEVSFVKYVKNSFTFLIYLKTKEPTGKVIGTPSAPIEKSTLHRSQIK